MNNIPLLVLSERLILFSVLIQNLEMIYLRKNYSNQGVWSWSVLQKDYPNPLGKKIYSFIFSYQPFLLLQILSAISCLFGILIPQAPSLWFATLVAVLTCLRWRGNFNGGSDYMSVLILTSLSLCSLSKSNSTSQLGLLAQAGIAYVAVQTVFSYFIAGWVKIKRSSWRQGTALTQLLTLSNYNVQPAIQRLVSQHKLSLIATWSVLLFECLFPFSLLHPDLCLMFIFIMFLFHLINAWALGLNRFWLSWMASYPILYFFCLQLSSHFSFLK